MRTFPLRIGTPDGLLFEGEVQRIVCRSITGDLAILAGHCNFCTALGMGEAHVILEDGTSRSAACIGGMLTVMDGNCSLLATTWEWQEDIDVDRAGKAKERAQEKLAKGGLSDKEYKIVEAKLQRALVRLSVKGEGMMKEDSFAWKMVFKVRLFFLCIKVCGHQYIGLCYCEKIVNYHQ